MARDFIKIDQGLTTQKFASELISAINSLRQTQVQFTRIAELMSHMNDGSNFTDIETYFGLPAGVGSGTNTIVSGVVTALDVNAVNTLTGGRAG